MAPDKRRGLDADVGITCDRPTSVTLRTEWDKGFYYGTNIVLYDNGDRMDVSLCEAWGNRCISEQSATYADVTSLKLQLEIGYKATSAEVVRHHGTLYVDYN